MKHSASISGIFLFLLLLAGLPAKSETVPGNSLNAFSGEKGTIRISGGTAHIPVMKEAARRIMRFNPDIRITIAGGGSGAGIKQVGEGLVDIGNSGRCATDVEISKYGLRVFAMAIDGVGIIVNPLNPVCALSTSQLRDIYSGKINNWRDLGGGDGPITVYTRDNSSGTREVFWDKALGRGTITDKAHFAISNGAMKAAVSQDPNGIGYISAGHIDESVVPVALDGVTPGLENIRTGRYPISRILYSNTGGNPTRLTLKLVEYLLAPEGQALFKEKGFIPVK